jgi:phage recombination protein Bet
MSQAIVEHKPQQYAVLEFNPSQIDLIKKTIAKDATDDELQMFMYLAKQYRLDPFKKEIHFAKFDGTASFITARDGYLKIAMEHPDYEGLISFVVKENDTFEIDASEYKITHKFHAANRGKIIGAWARCDRKGKRPQICYVEFDEYKKEGRNGKKSMWEKFPSAMIQKVAEVFVLRRQFNISGLVAREEIDYSDGEGTLVMQQSYKPTPTPQPTAKPQLPPTDPNQTQIVPKAETQQARNDAIAVNNVNADISDADFDENIEDLLNLAQHEASLEGGFDFEQYLSTLKVKDANSRAEARFIPQIIGGTAKANKLKINGHEFFVPISQCVEENGGVWVPTWLLRKKADDITK